jgi:hypothetical protein
MKLDLGEALFVNCPVLAEDGRKRLLEGRLNDWLWAYLGVHLFSIFHEHVAAELRILHAEYGAGPDWMVRLYDSGSG